VDLLVVVDRQQPARTGGGEQAMMSSEMYLIGEQEAFWALPSARPPCPACAGTGGFVVMRRRLVERGQCRRCKGTGRLPQDNTART
jgi:DnaJ-class molecular chaperone